jgi:hypothetical protein
LKTGTHILVHHMLHGEAEGHRELASSIQLSPRDARTVRLLSAAARPGVPIPWGGYMMGYPLEDSSYYVLALTGIAGSASGVESLRTYSLLVDIADLPLIRYPQPLLRALGLKPFLDSSYGEASRRQAVELDVSFGLMDPDTVYDSGVDELPAMPAMFAWTKALLVALYEAPSEAIVAPRVNRPSTLATDEVMLSVWAQQWPRLRRKFRFCTHPLSKPVQEEFPFDLQLCEDQGDPASVDTRAFNLAVSSVKAREPEWMATSIRDLMRPGPLRRFLAAAASEDEGGRASYVRLAERYRFS